jgi:hypothetical protein
MKVKELSPQLFKRGIENVAYKNILSPLKKTFSKFFFGGYLSSEIATKKGGIRMIQKCQITQMLNIHDKTANYV